MEDDYNNSLLHDSWFPYRHVEERIKCRLDFEGLSWLLSSY